MVDAGASRPIFGYWKARVGPRGSINRCLLGYAGVDFEDKQYSSAGPLIWSEDKPNLGLDFPNLPYLIDGDFKITESRAVSAYICARWAPALLGADPVEKGAICMMHNVVYDWMFSFFGMAMKSSEPPSVDDVYAKAKTGLEPIVAYLGVKQYLASAEVSLVDFLLWEGLETILQIT